MKVELEIVVNRAPKQSKLRKKKVKEKKQREKRYREFLLPNGELGYETDSNYTPSSSSSSSYYSSDWSSSAGSSWASFQQGRRRAKRTFSSSSVALSSTKSSDSTPRMDIEAELQALQEEIGSSSSSEESDGLGGFGEKDNPWNHPSMRWKLGVGGTVGFVPDAERYGHAPSLPPPPPRSMLGQSRVRIKPRLPLDISNHRYRDEHPNVWAPDPWEPSKTDRRAFEEKLMTLDFLASCSKSLTRLPPIERERDAGKHEVALGHLVQQDAHHSIAWKDWLEKERRKKEKERRKAAAEAEAAAASTEASTAEPSSSLIGDSQFLQEPSASLEAGASMISAGSLGMPSEAWGARGHPRR
uniref:Uncharacterized protein n=1 Tax=Alexandrium catenella TaxID=2925 RepID=A0A7S1LHL0_ALECA